MYIVCFSFSVTECSKPPYPTCVRRAVHLLYELEHTGQVGVVDWVPALLHIAGCSWSWLHGRTSSAVAVKTFWLEAVRRAALPPSKGPCKGALR